MANFLIKQPNSDFYYVRLDIPERLQAHYGKKVLKKSLRTKDLGEAKALSNRILGEWRNDFLRIEGNWKLELFEAVKPQLEILRHSQKTDERIAAAKELARIKSEYIHKYGDTFEITDEMMRDYERQFEQSLTYKVQNPGKLVGMPENPNDEPVGPLTRQITEIVEGRNVPKADLFRSALLKQFSEQQKDHVEPKTHDMRLGALNEISKFFKGNSLPLDKASVQEYLASIKSQALTTKKRKLAAGKLYYDFLQAEGLVSGHSTNPFSGHKLKERQKEAAKAKRQPFKPHHIEKLYEEAIRRKDQALADCIMIDAYTGMRIEEVCQLTVKDVDDCVFIVKDAKTEAGIREVPIHPALLKRIKALCEESEDGYLIPSTSDNKYGKRSDTLSKRFRTIKIALGFGPELVFHSIRKTVATTLEHAGVTESVAADILGHEKPTMTFGLYSGGSSLKQRKEAIGKLKYKF